MTSQELNEIRDFMGYKDKLEWTDERIAKEMGVDIRTVYLWKSEKHRIPKSVMELMKLYAEEFEFEDE